MLGLGHQQTLATEAPIHVTQQNQPESGLPANAPIVGVAQSDKHHPNTADFSPRAIITPPNCADIHGFDMTFNLRNASNKYVCTIFQLTAPDATLTYLTL